MGKEIHLIAVGKFKDPHLETLERDYLKRLTSFSLLVYEVKANAHSLESEAQLIEQKIHDICKNQSRTLILLDEGGPTMTSKEFSTWLFEKVESENGKILFLIGGHQGFHSKTRQLSSYSISLSPMTFPHKLARLFLIEQIYRAQGLRTGHPYHK